MKAFALLSLFSLPTAVFAAVGGRCSGTWNTNQCICLDHNVCTGQYGGTAFQGSPGDYPCPNDADNVWGCTVWDHCPGKDSSTGCVWRSGCPGTILDDPVCPGGNDFVCCDYN